MSQKFTVLVDLDGTIVDTAPDLMNAHNYVMKKFGYETKTTEEIRNLVNKVSNFLSCLCFVPKLFHYIIMCIH